MDNIVIPDDFYFNEGVLAHISCIYCHKNDRYSNDKFIPIHIKVKQFHIDNLRDICNMYDILNEKTYFEENKYKNMHTRMFGENTLELFDGSCIKFDDINKLLEYLAKNYPECIRNDDIKIALKN
jgi:hypothetical protein